MSFKVNQLIFRGVTCCIFFIFSFTSAEDPVAALPTFTYDDAEIAAAKKAILERTNMYRCMHNAVPLEMDEEISKHAHEHTVKMATEIKGLEMSESPDYGEDVGLVSAYIKPTTVKKPDIVEKALEIVNDLYDSVQKDPDNVDATTSFSQLVWKASTHLGIGISTQDDPQDDGNKFLLFYATLNFKPPGNIKGQHEENVELKASKTKEECTKQ